jgi:hypothetical protein
MSINVIEWDAECVEDHGEIPNSGDILKFNSNKYVVISVNIFNRSKVQMRVAHMREEIKEYTEPQDHSANWEKIDEKYMPKKKTSFLEDGLSP